jgi:beta-glucosidase
MRSSRLVLCVAALAALLPFPVSISSAQGQQQPPKAHHAWDDKSLSPDQRADMVIKEMTLDEKFQLVHGTGWGALREGDPIPPRSNLGASYVLGIDRLGIPDINMRIRRLACGWQPCRAGMRHCCLQHSARHRVGIRKARSCMDR